MINHRKKKVIVTIIDSNEKKINIDVLLIVEKQVFIFFYFSISFSADVVYKLSWFNIPSSSVDIILSWLLFLVFPICT